MLEEDEGAYYLEFFSQSLGMSALIALFLAPMVPGWVAQYFLVAVIVVAAIAGNLFFWIRKRFLSLPEADISSSLAQTIVSEEASAMFRVTGSTTLVICVAICWLGFAGMLWIFESFFVLFAAVHIATSLVYTFLELVAIRGEIDDLTNSVYGAQPVDDAEEAE